MSVKGKTGKKQGLRFLHHTLLGLREIFYHTLCNLVMAFEI